MNLKHHPWEAIYARDGRVFTEPFPGFEAVAERFANIASPPKLKYARILDLGCGNGRHVVGLKVRGVDVTGLDISPSGLRLSRDWLAEHGLQAGLVCGDMRMPLPFEDGSFDGLLSTQVIHHSLLAEIRRTIAEIWRVLADGGIAFVSVAGRRHEDVAYEEVEPGTFVPLTGTEAGLPHHFFAEEEFCQEFRRFEIQEIGTRANGKVLAAWLKKACPVV